MGFKNINLAFFNLGPWEILLILVVVLILFGAKRLPELARGLGQGINEFRDAVDSSKEEIINGIEDDSKNNLEKDSEEWVRVNHISIQKIFLNKNSFLSFINYIYLKHLF